MALTTVPGTGAQAGTTAAAPKQIVVSGFAGAAGQLTYTVPSGRTCTGTVFGLPNGNTPARFGITVGTTQYTPTVGFQAGGTSIASVGYLPLTLLAGTSLSQINSGDGTNVTFIGVES